MNEKSTDAEYGIKSFTSRFGIALNRVLWWQRQEEMGTQVLVIAFDNKERFTLRDEEQVTEALDYFERLEDFMESAPKAAKTSTNAKPRGKRASSHTKTK